MKYKEEISKFGRIAENFFDHKEKEFEQAVREICARLQSGRRIFIFGNGGSAADAQHIAAEFINRLKQQYAYRKILKDANAAGYNLVQEEVGKDRTIKLVVRKW